MAEESKIGPRIGAHKSIAKSIDLAIDRGLKSTCECLQIFTRPPRRWQAGKNSLEPAIVERFLEKSVEANYFDTAIHMPYLPNLSSPDNDLFNKSIKVLIEEVEKAAILRTPYIITHLGSPIKYDESFATSRVSQALNQACKGIKEPIMILLENSTAKRKPWGTKIEHFESIFSELQQSESIGICFDTAHAYSSGYDISSPEGLNEVIDSIDQLIGKNKLKLIHINDSKGKLGSGIDHHEHIGKGHIGLECFRELMQNPRFKKLPMILETPKDESTSDLQNLELLRKLRSKEL